jgi:VCBS repeat-containing protein
MPGAHRRPLHRKLANTVWNLLRPWVGRWDRIASRIQGWSVRRLLRGLGVGLTPGALDVGTSGLTPRKPLRSRRSGNPGCLALDPIEARVLLSAVVSTDRPDYAPGSTALFTATTDGGPTNNFQAGETIQFRVQRVDGSPIAAPAVETFNVTDGRANFTAFQDAAGTWQFPDLDGKVDGQVQARWYVDPQFKNAALTVTATGLSSGQVARASFTDSIGTPVLIGNAASSAAGTSIAITSTAVAAGNTVIVTIAMSANTGAVSVTDTRSNTYTKNADVTNTGNVRTLIFSAPVITALQAGDTITVTFGVETQSKAVSALQVSGLLSASVVDKTAVRTGLTSSASSGSTTTTAQSSELLIGAIGIADRSTGTAGTNFTAIGAIDNGDAVNGIGLLPEYRIVSNTGAFSASATTAAMPWAAAIVTYKADITGPVVAVTTPSFNATYGADSLGAFSGTVADGANGSGLNADSITFTLKRAADNNYWNGTSWQASAFPLPATNAATTGNSATTWTSNATLPVWSTLASGNYVVQATALDRAGNSSTSINTTFTLDNTTPVVTSVTGTNGNYKAGDILTIVITFSEPVDVAGGTPTLALNTGGVATYSGPSSGNTLSFTYMVGASDNISLLDYTSDSALSLEGATIKDAYGNSANITLASPGAAGSLGATSMIVLDNTNPSATITFPISGGRFNAQGWTSIAGTATDGSGSDIALIQISVKNDTLGRWWNPGISQFNTTVETFMNPTTMNPTMGLVNWSLSFPSSRLVNGSSYTIRAYTIDKAGNVSSYATASFTYDTAAPTLLSLVRSSPSGQYVNGTGVTYLATFSEKVAGLTADNFGFAAGSGTIGTPTTADDGITWSIPVSGLEAFEGTLTLKLANNANIKDLANNALSTASLTGASYIVDHLAPTVTFAYTGAKGAGGYHVAPGNITLTTADVTSGVASVTYSIDGAAPQTYITPVAFATEGVHTVSFTVTDTAGNSASDTSTLMIDSVKPTSSARNVSSTTSNSMTVNYTASDATSGIASVQLWVKRPGDTSYALTQTLTTAATSGSFTYLAAAGEGTYSFYTVAVDAAGNTEDAPADADATIVLNTAPPVVASIIRLDPSTTNLASVRWAVTFSVPVSGVDAADFQLVPGGHLVGAAITGVTGSDATWIVTASTGSGDGSLALELVDNDSIIDGAGNALAGNSDGSLTGPGYTIDKAAPSVLVSRVGPATTNAPSVTFILEFSEPVTGLTEAGFTVTNGTGILSGSGLSYALTVTPSGEGVVSVAVDAGAAHDAAGNANAPSEAAAVTYDLTAPAVSAAYEGTPGAGGWYTATGAFALSAADANGIAAITYRLDSGDSAAYTAPFAITGEGAHTVSYTITDTAGNSFTDSVSVHIDTVAPVTTAAPAGNQGAAGYYTSPVLVSLAPGDAASGVAATYYKVDTGSFTTYTSAFPVSADGTHIVAFYSVDVAGNVEATQTLTIRIDKTAPTVSAIIRTGDATTDAAQVAFTVTFSEPVTGVDAIAFVLATTGVSDASIASVSGEGATYTVSVNTGTGNGTIGLNLVDNDSIVDAAGNLLGGTGDGGFTGEVYTLFRNTAPTDIALSSASLAENAGNGTAVGTFSTSGPDTSDAFTYILVDGDGAADNAAFTIDDNTLKANASFDFEAKNVYTIRVRSTGQGGLFVEKVFTISVSNVNEAPVAVNASLSTDEDTAASSSLSAADPDTGDTRTFQLVASPSHGTLQLNADGSFTYTPDANFNGTDAFTFTATDAGGIVSAVGVLSITVHPVNDAPVTADKTVTLDEDGTYTLATGDFAFSDPSDTPADTFAAVIITTLPTAGTLRLNGTAVNAGDPIAFADIAAGLLTFAPAANASGTPYAAFTFQVQDNGGTASGGVDVSAPRAFTFNVLAVNDPAALSSATVDLTEADTAAAISTSGTLTISDIDSPQVFIPQSDIAGTFGTFTIDADGHWTYTATSSHDAFVAGVTYTDTFDVSAADGTKTSVTIRILGTNDAPVAGNNTQSTDEDTAVTFAAADLLLSASDVDGDTLTIIGVSTASAAGGTVSFDPDAGTITYTPAADFNGLDSFTYTISDGHGGIATGIVTVNVGASNDAPVAADGTATCLEDSVITGAVTATDTEHDPLTYSIISGPAHGTLTFHADGTFTYTPDANFFGQDNFTYIADDGTSQSAPATVLITVTPVNDAPKIDAATISPDAPTTNSTLSLVLASHDVENDAVTYTYQWYKNGEAIDGQAGAMLDLSLAGNGNAGDVIYAVITPHDAASAGSPYTTAAVTVGRDAPTVSVSWTGWTYGEAPNAPVASVTGHNNLDLGTPILLYYPGSTATGTPSTVAPTHAGTYTVVARFAGNSEYAAADSAPATITIARATLHIAIGNASHTYGTIIDLAAALDATIDGVNGETLAVAYTSTGNTTSAGVGSYTIAGVVTSNTGLASDYDITLTDGTLSITPRTLAIAANSASKTYGDDDPALTYTLTSGTLVNGDKLSGSLARQVGVAVGDYLVTQGSLTASDNYTITFTPGTFTIHRKAITVTANSASKTYGDAVTFTGTEFAVAPGALVGADAITSVLLASPGAARTAGVADSPYAITISAAVGSGLDNYTITYAPGELAVTKATLAVTVIHATRTYASANPAFAATYTGFVNGEDATALAGSLVFSTDADVDSPVGTYAVTASGLTSANYSKRPVKSIFNLGAGCVNMLSF